MPGPVYRSGQYSDMVSPAQTQCTTPRRSAPFWSLFPIPLDLAGLRPLAQALLITS